MGVQLKFVQPQFADNLVEAVAALFKVQGPENKVLSIARPDYTRPVGDASNLHRTSIFLRNQSDGLTVTPGPHVVHISNLMTREEGQEEPDVVTIVFESFPGTKQARSVTRHYIPQSRFENKLIKVTYRSKDEDAHDIWKFLMDGTAPAQS